VVSRVVFVSAGPGAADLITLRGARALAAAEVVLFDALADPALRELALTARWINVGKRGYAHAVKQPEINRLLVEAARTHQRVVRLKGGDASVFGRLEEELQALAAAGIESEVVPGVTAALAAAAQAQRPLTRRGKGRSVSLTTAMTQDNELIVGQHADTEVFYMAGQRLAPLARRLQQAGWEASTPVLVVSRAGCADALHSQHELQDLANAAVLHHGRPTVVTVGVGATPLTAAKTSNPRANPEPRLKSPVLPPATPVQP
jgi:uroporphyrin-III C-methyltransferase